MLLALYRLGLICLLSWAATAESRLVRLQIEHGNYVKVGLGTPAQEMKLLLNTGSANTWVLATHSKPALVYSTLYDHSASSTYKGDGRKWKSQMGAGIVMNGTLVVDNLHLIDSFSKQAIVLKEQTFGEVSAHEGWISEAFYFDGALGLGSRHQPSVQLSNPVQNLFNQGEIDEQSFSIHLKKLGNNPQYSITTQPSTNRPMGTLILGGADSRFFTGPVVYKPTIDKTLWRFRVKQVSLTRPRKVFARRLKATIDSTTNIIIGPRQVVQQLQENFLTTPSDEFDLFQYESCNSKIKSSLQFDLGGITVTIPPEDLVIKLRISDREICYSTIGYGSSDDEWILGTPFMRNAYTVYKYTNQSIGFAQPAQ